MRVAQEFEEALRAERWREQRRRMGLPEEVTELCPEAAAQVLGVSSRTVRRGVHDGWLPGAQSPCRMVLPGSPDRLNVRDLRWRYHLERTVELPWDWPRLVGDLVAVHGELTVSLFVGIKPDPIKTKAGTTRLAQWQRGRKPHKRFRRKLLLSLEHGTWDTWACLHDPPHSFAWDPRRYLPPVTE